MSDEMSARERILLATSQLLERQGYYATGLRDILKESNTPKGSLYHYFPDGKEGLAVETIETRSQIIAQVIRETLNDYDDPAEAIYTHLCRMAAHMERTNCQTGPPMAAVALEASGHSERIRQVCESGYDLWRREFETKLLSVGIDDETAARLSLFIISAVEGAVIQARVRGSKEPIIIVAGLLRDLIHQHTPSA